MWPGGCTRTLPAAALQAAHSTALRCPPSPLCSAHPAMQCVVSRALKLQEAAPGPCLLLLRLLQHCRQPLFEPILPHDAADNCIPGQMSEADWKKCCLTARTTACSSVMDASS